LGVGPGEKSIPISLCRVFSGTLFFRLMSRASRHFFFHPRLLWNSVLRAPSEYSYSPRTPGAFFILALTPFPSRTRFLFVFFFAPWRAKMNRCAYGFWLAPTEFALFSVHTFFCFFSPFGPCFKWRIAHGPRITHPVRQHVLFRMERPRHSFPDRMSARDRPVTLWPDRPRSIYSLCSFSTLSAFFF